MVWKACLQAVWTALQDMSRKYRYFRECVRRYSRSVRCGNNFRRMRTDTSYRHRRLHLEFRARRKAARRMEVSPLDFNRWPDGTDSLAYEYGFPDE
jgi:hypothetical protein